MGDAAVLAEARRRFASLDSDPKALDGPAKALWLGIVATNASPADWDKPHRLAPASKSTVERRPLYTLPGAAKARPEDRRVGKVCVSQGRSRGSPDPKKKNKKK